MVDNNSLIVKEFLLESFEALSSISDELTTYEKNPDDKELLNSIFRKVHTLKGSASFLGLKKLQQITHSAETLLDFIREGTIRLNEEMIDVFLECFDCCQELLKSIEETGKENNKNYAAIVGKFTNVLEKNTLTSELPVGTGAKIHKELLNQELQELQETKKITVAAIKVEKMETKIDKKYPTPTAADFADAHAKDAGDASDSSDQDATLEKGAKKTSGLTDSVVRVNVQLLDKIMNIVGELVLNRNQILQYANVIDSSDLNRLAQQLNIITTELQTDIMTTRMQPVGSVLTKFERIVRDLARSQNKKIRLEIFGKETELDKTLLEAIRDPLTHLIRNSVDHGVELPEARKASGKNEEGKIVIRSYHEGGQVTIEIKDDGKGIDPQRILEKAIQKGIITSEEGAKMSVSQILSIIFKPGFSTAEYVTNISGRGVGLDVVKSNIEKIGGSVDISSKPGEGTTFKLKIPLTLAIVPALVVQDKNETFAIPQVNLVELVRLEGAEMKEKLELLHDAEFYRLRGNLIPIFRLSECLKLTSKIKSTEEGDSISIVILSAEGRVYGLIVDSILDTEEIVVKPLGKKLKKLSFFAGATIMGDGRVALIIDALGFFNAVDQGHGQKADSLVAEETVLQNDGCEDQEVLLCSLGDNRNYAIPLMLVNRLENFQSKDIEWTGDQALMKYGNVPMPLINLEKSLKLKGPSALDTIKENSESIIACVVIRIRNQVFGFIVDTIKDIAISDGGINSESVDRAGLLGTIFVIEKTIPLLDIHGIIEMQKIGKGSLVKKLHAKQQARILLVEDSPLYRKVLRDMLEDDGYTVTTVNNGKEGVDFLEKGEKIDLIITDIEMPIMDGWDFSKTVRSSNKNYAQIPIIAVSTKVSSQDKDKGVSVGFTQHLEKLNKEEVLKTVSDYTNLK